MRQCRAQRNNWLQRAFSFSFAKDKKIAVWFCFHSDELIVYVINEKKQYYLQKNPKNLRQCLTKIFIFCYVWSFGGGLKVRKKKHDEIQETKTIFAALFSVKIISKMITSSIRRNKSKLKKIQRHKISTVLFGDFLRFEWFSSTMFIVFFKFLSANYSIRTLTMVSICRLNLEWFSITWSISTRFSITNGTLWFHEPNN